MPSEIIRVPVGTACKGRGEARWAFSQVIRTQGSSTNDTVEMCDQQEKTGPRGDAARLSSCRRGMPALHLPEGNHCLRLVAIWEDSKTARIQHVKSIGLQGSSGNAQARAPAMRDLQVYERNFSGDR